MSLTGSVEDERPFISASQLAGLGSSVLFNDKGGEIATLATGKRTALHRRGSIYVLRMWVLVDPQDFLGPGK